MKKQLLVFGTGFTMVALTACGTEETEGDASSSGDDPIQVVSTIGQLDDAVTNIGGDLVDNHALMALELTHTCTTRLKATFSFSTMRILFFIMD